MSDFLSSVQDSIKNMKAPYDDKATQKAVEKATEKMLENYNKLKEQKQKNEP